MTVRAFEKIFLCVRKALTGSRDRSQFSSGLRSAKIRRWVVHRCQEESGRLLDVGCGEGLLLQELKDSGLALYGLDLDPENLKKAMYPDSGRETGLMQGDARRLPFRDGTFHWVICLNVLMNLESDEYVREILHELGRVCKGEGRILIDFRNRWNLWTALSYRLASLYDSTCPALRHFSKREMSSLLREVGIRILGVYPLEPFLGPVATAFLVEGSPKET